MNSGLIKKEVVHYMFGYYVTCCWKSDNFWCESVSRDSAYWCLFRRFAEQMNEIEFSDDFRLDTDNYYNEINYKEHN